MAGVCADEWTDGVCVEGESLLAPVAVERVERGIPGRLMPANMSSLSIEPMAISSSLVLG